MLYIATYLGSLSIANTTTTTIFFFFFFFFFFMASSKDSNSTPKPLHAFFIPWFATGHMIPMVDIACLFASRGVESTLLVTPANAKLIRRTVENSASSGLPIRTILYPFPSAESGLPPGVENLASVPQSDIYKVDAATPHARPALESLLRLHRPDTIVADLHFSWTFSVAKDLGMAGLIFHGVGLLPVCAFRSLIDRKPYNSVSDDDESFLVSGLPHPIRMVRPEMPDFFLRPVKELSIFGRDIVEAETSALGAVVNSFSGIESAYADHYSKTDGVRSWFVGPVALAVSSSSSHAIRGGDDDASRQSIMAWLDKKPSKSVVYLCFGSWCYFSAEQIAEIASGLEKSGHWFLWVVREEFDLPEGFGGEKGMVVRGWAPQVEILSHWAVGGFVTHCGWNSLLEGITAGLPMVTWPLSTEQFINEKLLVDVLRIGVKNWNGFRTTVVEKVVVVNGEDFGAAVRKIMGSDDEEAEGMRRRAREYGDMARAAVEEGGSSYNGLSRLIDEIRAFSLSKIGKSI